MIQSVSTKKPSYGILKLGLGGLSLLALLLGGLGYWATTAELAGAVIAPGAIKVEYNRQVVQHLYGGIVEEVLVKEGERVLEDQVLIRLDPSELQTELLVIERQLAEIMARRGRYIAERDGDDKIRQDRLWVDLKLETVSNQELLAGQERLFQARLENLHARVSRLREKIGQITSQIHGLDAQQQSIVEQKALIEQELVSQQTLLAQNLAQVSRVLSVQREQARLKGLNGELIAKKAQAQGQITELELEILNQAALRQEEAITILRDLEVQIIELTRHRNLLQQRMRRLEVRAPVDGVVYDLTVFARNSVVRPAEPLLYLVPQDQLLVISAQVRPSDIDQIYLQQPVSLKFSTFNQRTTPELFGRVDTVSADAFTDETSGQSFYRVEIRLDPGELDKLPDGSILVPGMPVDSFIQTISQTPLDYLLQPFTDYLDRAFRES